jgi:hypothetical protein
VWFEASGLQKKAMDATLQPLLDEELHQQRTQSDEGTAWQRRHMQQQSSRQFPIALQ